MLSIAIGWLLIAGFLVMLTQAGFAMLATGLCRAKNAAHTMSMALMVYPLACLAFWAYGFAIGWGNWYHGPAAAHSGWHVSLGPGTAALNSGLGIDINRTMATERHSGEHQFGLIGTKGFFLSGLDDPGVLALFFFMMMLLNLAATIPLGAMAERWTWRNFCLYALWAALPTCLHANWVWGGGWLAQAGINWRLGHGAVDCAGSGAVHAIGGLSALVGARLLGPRLGKYIKGRPQPLTGHHVPMVVAGTFLLAFGWFGINSGAALAGTDLRASLVVVNTALAGVAAAVAAMLTLRAKHMKPDPTMICNGLLAGLVAISASCAFVDPWAAAAIGAIAGALAILSVLFWEKRGVDDPVGAISIHGINGLWGLIALGIFANGKYGAGFNGVVRQAFVQRFGHDGVRGLLFGDASQLAAQLLDAAVVVLVSMGLAYAWFKLSRRIAPLRVSPETELAGLDGPEMGAVGYPDFTVAKRG